MAALLLVTLTLYTVALQVVAIALIAVSASQNPEPGQAAGAQVSINYVISIRAALLAALAPGLTLLGYLALAAILALVAGSVWVFVIAALAYGGGGLAFLSGAVAIIGLLGLLALVYWLIGRLVPAVIQISLESGAVRWSWRATRGKYWGVFGRFLLWSLIASVVVQAILTMPLLPVYALQFAAGALGNIGVAVGTDVLTIILIGPVSVAWSAISYIWVVPIWRDLTDDERCRSIHPYPSQPAN